MLALEILIERGALHRHVRLYGDAGILVLTGPSGAGKSSILDAIAGLLRPRSGFIEIDGRRVFDSQAGIDIPVHRRDIGYVFQDARLFPQMSVRANLRYSQRRDGGPLRLEFDEVVELLGIEALLDRRPHTLSGGEAQRVAIGRALLSRPRLLLLDEPLAALDQVRRRALLDCFGRIHAQWALPMVYVSHRLEEVRALAGRHYDLQ